jgi:phosphatidate cytidylyltransferase
VKNNLVIRLTTAAVVSPLLLLLLFLGPAWGWYLMVLCATGLAGLEIFAMTHPEDSTSRVVGVAFCMVVSVILYCYTSDARVLVTTLLGVTLLSSLVPLWRLGDLRTAGTRMLSSIAAPWYLGLLTCLALIRRDMDEQGAGYVLMTLMFAWMADTGGYFFGRSFGKHPLYPAVSPKKTWEGLLGALLGAVFGALLAHFWYLPEIPLGHAVLLGLLAGILGQLGDLAESLLKRSTAVKDSGNIIPGHGGLLDRIDALLFASAAVYVYVIWVARGA